jgi:hypothetical protein
MRQPIDALAAIVLALFLAACHERAPPAAHPAGDSLPAAPVAGPEASSPATQAASAAANAPECKNPDLSAQCDPKAVKPAPPRSP